MKKPFEPNFKTPEEQISKEEKNKLNLHQVTEQFGDELRNSEPDLTWEAEQIAKSNGIYLEFDRSIKGAEKHWMYMIRISNPGGGPISPEHWAVFDDLAEKYGKDPQGHSSIRFTTRQAIQFHWISKKGVLDIVKTLAEHKFNSLNACGDNTRNVMGTPLSYGSDIFDSCALAQKLGQYFQLPVDPFIKIFAINPEPVDKPKESYQYGPKLLNRKFKIAVSGFMRDQKTDEIIPDNSIEILTNDLGVAPILENGTVKRYQIYVGGGQGERNGKPSTAALAKPLGIVTEGQLMQALNSVVKVHEEWGDRQNRHWARLKYVIKKQGVEWFRRQVEEKCGFSLTDPKTDHDYGNRQLYFGWHDLPNGHLAYGMFIENGRIKDNSPNGKLKTLIREIMDTFPVELMVTANQDVLFINLPKDQKKAFEELLAKHNYGQRNGKPYSTLRQMSGACVGLDTCRLSYTESEKFEPVLIDELEKMGWSDLKESIGITGCERQCFRPGTKTIGLVGSGSDRYMFKLFGDESARFQGRPLISPDGEELYLRSVKREDVPTIIDVLLKDFMENKENNEGLGAYHRRIGDAAIIDLLRGNEKSAPSMERPFNTNCVLD